MNRSSIIPITLASVIVLFGMMSIPSSVRNILRSKMVATTAPLWNLSSSFTDHLSSEQKEILRLQTENRLLAEEVDSLKELFQYQMQILENNLSLSLETTALPKWESLYRVQLQSLPAKVIYRPRESWGSFAWINLGKKDNLCLPVPVIQKNSPVVLGNSLVGVIDFVGNRQSRVRLLTDQRFSPSVRVLRNEKEVLERKEKPQLLAKGELCGAIDPYSPFPLLRGTGFNYDFADDEGSSRDLRTGKEWKQFSSDHSPPLIQEGDLLVTTGFDGIFPPGLFVARVLFIHPLQEGDYYYDLNAIPTAENLPNLSTVFVLPPYQPELPPKELSPYS